MQALAEGGILKIDDLIQARVDQVQLLLNKSVHQANKLKTEAKRFPRFNLAVKELEHRVIVGKGVESIIEIMVELRHSKQDLKGLFLKDADNQQYHVAALTTTGDPKVCFS